MSCNSIHSGDFGTLFLATVLDCGSIVNLSGYTTLQMDFRMPGYPPSYMSKAASLYTDGTDGKMKYISASGDFTVPGTWQMQGVLINPSGQWRSDVTTFKVLGNL